MHRPGRRRSPIFFPGPGEHSSLQCFRCRPNECRYLRVGRQSIRTAKSRKDSLKKQYRAQGTTESSTNRAKISLKSLLDKYLTYSFPARWKELQYQLE